jgi:hypothetical protein
MYIQVPVLSSLIVSLPVIIWLKPYVKISPLSISLKSNNTALYSHPLVWFFPLGWVWQYFITNIKLYYLTAHYLCRAKLNNDGIGFSPYLTVWNIRVIWQWGVWLFSLFDLSVVNNFIQSSVPLYTSPLYNRRHYCPQTLSNF